MIQRKRFGNNLHKFNYDVIDNSSTSPNYFRVFDINDKFYLGKNSFRIRSNSDVFIKDSMLYIDIIDSNGTCIYHEVADFIGSDDSRLIIAHIYENTPPGEATLYIAGRLSQNPKTGKLYKNTEKDRDIPNILWSKKIIIIPTEENTNEVIFSTPPIIHVFQRTETFKDYNKESRDNRKQVVSGSILTLRSPNVRPNESTKKIDEKNFNTSLDPELKGEVSYTITSKNVINELYYDETFIYDSEGKFIPDMKGGIIELFNFSPTENPDINIPYYKFDILDIIDKRTAKISPAFIYDHNGVTYTSFKNVSSEAFITFFDKSEEIHTINNESFVQIDFEQIEPIAGTVNHVEIKYKPYGTFGDFIDIGKFELKKQNYFKIFTELIQEKNEIVERPAGKFNSLDLTYFWTLQSKKYSVLYFDSNILNNGIYLTKNNTLPNNNEFSYKLSSKPGLSIHGLANTEYEITFKYNIESKINNSKPATIFLLIDKNISIQRDLISDYTLDAHPYLADEGTLVNLISEQGTGKTNEVSFTFILNDDKPFIPIFLFKNIDSVHLSDVFVYPRTAPGYNQNQAYLYVPLETMKMDSEIILNVSYHNKIGNKSKIENFIYGLNFMDNEIPGLNQRIERATEHFSSSIADLQNELTTVSGSLENRVTIIEDNMLTGSSSDSGYNIGVISHSDTSEDGRVHIIDMNYNYIVVDCNNNVDLPIRLYNTSANFSHGDSITFKLVNTDNNRCMSSIISQGMTPNDTFGGPPGTANLSLYMIRKENSEVTFVYQPDHRPPPNKLVSRWYLHNEYK